MNLKLLTQNQKLARLLKNNIGYLGHELLNLTSEEKSDSVDVAFTKAVSSKFIVIVARQHYTESWQTYSALSLKELKSILTLQQKNQSGFNNIQRIIINKEQDGFDVKTIMFSKKIAALLPNKTVLIPETELLRSLVSDDEKLVVQIDSPNGLLYWAHSGNKVHSAYKKGLLNNLEIFIQSVGLPEGTATYKVSDKEFSQLLFTFIQNTSVAKLIKIASLNLNQIIDANRLHRLYIAPLAVATIFVLLTNSYVYLQKSLLNNQIEESSPVTSDLLVKKRRVDQIEQLVGVLNHEFSSLEATHETWLLLDKVMEAGMRVTRFKRFEQGIELRGTAPKSSKVLSELNTLPQVSGAAFVGSVRKSKGQDAFTISLQFAIEKNLSKPIVNKDREG